MKPVMCDPQYLADQYEALRDQGYSKEKAARIANTKNSGKKGGKASNYEDRTKGNYRAEE